MNKEIKMSPEKQAFANYNTLDLFEVSVLIFNV